MPTPATIADTTPAREATVRRSRNPERNARMLAMRAEGKTLQAIADHFGVTNARVSQIVGRSDAPKAAVERPAIAGVRPLLLPASYVPTPIVELGERGRRGVCVCGESFRHISQRGPVPKVGPCCKEKKVAAAAPQPRVKQPRRPRQFYTADDILRRLTAPGNALVAFDGGVTLFIGKSHFQADTVYAAMQQADDAEIAA